MKSNTTQEMIAKLQRELDGVLLDIENYFEGDNSEHFGEAYYRNLENRKAELEERISNLA
jgi:hypothetical protein